jgi:hypothetical protein
MEVDTTIEQSQYNDIPSKDYKPSIIFSLQTPKQPPELSKEKRKTDILTWQMKVQAQPIHEVFKKSNKLITLHQWKVSVLLFNPNAYDDNPFAGCLRRSQIHARAAKD